MHFIDLVFFEKVLHQIAVYRSAAIVAPLVEKPNVNYFAVRLADRLDVSIVRWDFLNACLIGDSSGTIDLPQGSFVEQLIAINDVVSVRGKSKCLYLVDNFQAMLAGAADAETVERLRQALTRTIAGMARLSSYLLLLDDRGCLLPTDLQQIIPEEMFPLPSLEHITDIVQSYGFDDPRLYKIASGLSAAEIDIGLRLAINSGEDIADRLLQFKVERLKKLGLEFLGVPEQMSFGGLDVIKARLQSIKQDFSPIARKFNIPLPRGWLFVGPPGTGKTRSAKCIAGELSLPLISVGIDAIQAGGVSRFKELLKRLERIVCIVYFDELDKFFDDSTDSQILGVLLTWMQEKTSDNFLIATLNRLSEIRPEVMRAGRIDDVFWVGFPQNNEKYEIVMMYAAKYDPAYRREFGRMSQEEWITLMNLTMNFTGSELKLLVETAVRNQFHSLFDRLEGCEAMELYFSDFKNALASVLSIPTRCATSASRMSTSYILWSIQKFSQSRRYSK